MGDKIVLDEDSVWLQFVIGGKEFSVEVFEACDLLAHIDNKHADDLHRCFRCKGEFCVVDIEPGEPIVCPTCKKSDEVRANQSFLDDVGDLLRDRFGVPRCSRRESLKFYEIVVSRANDAKKNISTPAE